MKYIPEASIITTKDGLHCQVYTSRHPEGRVIVKPKYVPTDKISSSAFSYRYIGGRKMIRLNMWAGVGALKKYLAEFQKAYPEYIYRSPNHNQWFFAVPEEKIEKIYYPREGLRELLSMPKDDLDPHLKNVVEFVALLKKSGVKTKDMGITYSTLMGHYYLGVSDINVVVYGKENFRRIVKFLGKAKHPKLRFKTDEEWLARHKKRGRKLVMSPSEFLAHASRKKSEGFFAGHLFVIHGVEKPDEAWMRWDETRYEPRGLATIKGTVVSDLHAGVRPGCYELENAAVVGKKKIPVKYVAFFSRDFVLQAKKGETIEARGLLEKVFPAKGKSFFRIVLGYPESFVSGRRNKEYIKVVACAQGRK